MNGLILILVLVALSPILAVIAWVQASSAQRSIAELQARLAGVLDELRTLQTQVALSRTAPPSPARPTESASAEASAPVEALVPVEAPAPIEALVPVEAPATVGASARGEASAYAESAETEPSSAEVPTAEPERAAVPGRAVPAAASLEERLGTRWAVWIGGAALALGGVLLVRYSMEQGFFGPAMRVALASVFSLVLVAGGEWFRRAERASPVEAIPAAHIPGILTAAGTIIAFGTAYAAHALYQFIGPAAAFVVLGAIGVAAMFAAALHGPALAGLGLAGALVVPLLITSQQPDPWPVVLYLAVVAGAGHALARARRWQLLAYATVAGALVWGFALLDPVSSGAPGAWASALFVHVAVQMALAAAFIAVEPHLTTGDAAAEPDWIAAIALGAFTVLAVRTLHAASAQEQWTAFAAVALAILGATAWRSAPAAAAAVLGGTLALGAITVWPGVAAPSEPGVLPPALQGVLRLPETVTPSGLRLAISVIDGVLPLPEDVSSFLVFAAVSTLSVNALATLRLWRGRTLSLALAGLYALAAVVTPLLALVLAYLRVSQFDRSIPFALSAVVLAAAFYFIADRFDKVAPADRPAAIRIVIGAFASGVAAAMALGFVMVLDRGYLTVAFAITAFTTAIFAVVDRIALLRYVVVAIGIVVLGRLVWDPRIMGADVGSWPILNWLLFGYGVPALAFLGAGHILKRDAEDLAARLCDALGLLFAALLAFFQIRHALNGGDPLAATSGHVEQGLFALMSLGFAAVLIRADLGRANPVFRAASLIFGVISAGVILIGLGLVENPLFSSDIVQGPVVLSSLALAYLLPGLAAAVLVRIARGARPEWYVSGATALCLLLLFGYVALEVRHAFQGESLAIWRGTSASELGVLTLAGLGFAAALIWMDGTDANPVFRLASLVFSGLSVAVILLGLGLLENPLLTGDLVRGPVVLNPLAVAYLLPALGAIGLALITRGVRPDWNATSTALALLLLFGYLALEVRHAFHGENLAISQGTSASELGVLTLLSLGFATALIRMEIAHANPVFRDASLAFGGLSAAAILLGLGLVKNPLLGEDLVRGPVVFNPLAVAYLLPAVGAIVLTRIARGARPAWYVSGAAALALLLLFGYVTLEVRHAFQGDRLSISQSTSAPEVWSYSVAWLALGLALLFYGLWRNSTEARLASAALVVLTVLKVFLYDLTGIGGFWRAFSVICLGAVLIGIGLVYQKLVFARPQAPPGA
jgi:uncharacterized membrane protein